MTKIESHPVELDELPPWDESDAPDHDDFQPSSADAAALAPYTFDSAQRTLVGIGGPQGRPRRSRPTIAAPESQRMPQSEPPGPFIADDDDADERLLLASRGRSLGKRALVLSGLVLIPLAAVALVRGLSSHEPSRNQLHVAATPIAPNTAVAGESEPRADVRIERDEQHTQAHDEPVVDAKPEGLQETSKAVASTAPAGEKVARETVAPSAVKLAELPSNGPQEDRSNGDVNAGTIQIGSTPPSNVVLDGRPLGKSPRAVRVEPGLHTLVFIHPLYGRRSLSVDVHSGATTGASAEF